MVKVQINNNIIKLQGHAGFHENGHDLVCCAISTLTCNLINSLEQLTKSEIEYTTASGDVEIKIKSLDTKGSFLIDSFKLGLIAINAKYNCISFLYD